MKKLTSLLLALMMILGLSTTALAVSDTVTLTIEDPYAASEVSLFANTTAGREYVGYKLLNLTIGLKTSAHPDGCDGNNHTDGCYNYAYTVNATYREVLQNETYENGGLYLWENGIKPTKASLVTDEQINVELGKAVAGVNELVQSYKRMDVWVRRDEEFPKNTSKKIKRAGLADAILPQYKEKMGL